MGHIPEEQLLEEGTGPPAQVTLPPPEELAAGRCRGEWLPAEPRDAATHLPVV